MLHRLKGAKIIQNTRGLTDLASSMPGPKITWNKLDYFIGLIDRMSNSIGGLILNVPIFLFHRSANYNNKTGECDLTDMDRITLAGGDLFEQYEGKKYLVFQSKFY